MFTPDEGTHLKWFEFDKYSIYLNLGRAIEKSNNCFDAKTNYEFEHN